MLMIISPAKTLDEKKIKDLPASQPRFKEQSEELVGIMKKKSVRDLEKLMGISNKLATLNVERFNNFEPEYSKDNAKQALLMFKGDVYQGIQAGDFTEADLNFSQHHLRILSGLYGLLRPLDLIQPYRLEMGTKLKTRSFKGLYHYWDDTLTNKIQEDLKEIQSDVIINLASKEYFDALQPEELGVKVINIHFRELRNGDLKFISYNAKRSRGWMVRYVVKNRLTEAEQLKSFDWEGYEFKLDLSDDTNWYFVREG